MCDVEGFVRRTRGGWNVRRCGESITSKSVKREEAVLLQF